MQADFTIAVDDAARLVRIVMSGFFDTTDVDRFIDARDAACRALPRSRDGHVTLVDTRGMRIQPQNSVAQFADLLSNPRYRSRRIAFVVEPGLARMQLERVAAGRGGRFFRDPAAAEAWLLEERATAAALAADRSSGWQGRSALTN